MGQSDLGSRRRMKVFDQLAGALGSLKLGRREEMRNGKEQRDEKALRDNDVKEEQARDGMVEMFRKSVQELENRNLPQLEETQNLSSNNIQRMTKWGRMGNLNMSQGSGMPERHIRDPSLRWEPSRVLPGSARSRMHEGRTTSRMPEDMTRSGRVAKATSQRGEVEVLRFLSLKLVGGKLYLCPLPGCQFSTNREGMDAGRAAIHLTESHNMKVEPSKRISPTYACPLPYCSFTTNRQGMVSGFAAMHYVRRHEITMEEFLTNQRKLRFKRVEPSDHGLSKAFCSLSF